MYLREIQEHINATDEILAEISEKSLPEELRHFKNELLHEREILAHWVDVLTNTSKKSSILLGGR